MKENEPSFVPTPAPSLGDWARLMRAVACDAPPGGENLRAMAEEYQRSGRDEAEFLLWRAGVPIARESTEGADDSLQRALWRACRGGDFDAGALLSPIATPERPLLAQGAFSTIEVWTETELSALHALARLSALRGSAELRARAFSAARWHVEHVQPDNATNRPWAAHLFLQLSEAEGSADARLYAETLLHNCRVQSGRPDPLSALILLDGAEALEAHAPA